MQMKELVESIYQELLPGLGIESLNPYNLVVVHQIPQQWQLLGVGNYAAVLYHPSYPDLVVKIYAPGRPGFAQEVEVYRRLGDHPSFSKCLYVGKGFLILKRLSGITLYNCMYQGLRIPRQVIHDIDSALGYARSRGLRPHDVHGRNVIMYAGRGFVVDVSDFLHEENCSAWNDLKKAYYWLYRPFLSPLRLRLPYFVLDIVRKIYRRYRKLYHFFYCLATSTLKRNQSKSN
jgi:hypothetical protein